MQYVRKGLANGMTVAPFDVELCSDAQVKWDVHLQCHRVRATHVKCIKCRFLPEDWAKERIHPALRPGHLVLSASTPTRSCAHRKTYGVAMLGNIQRTALTQFPLIQAHAITGHKAQGQTLRRVVIAGLWRMGKTKLNSEIRAAGWFYTAASRATKRTALELRTEQIPTDHITMHRSDIADEMARLAVLHAHTTRMALTRTSDERTDGHHDTDAGNADNSSTVGGDGNSSAETPDNASTHDSDDDGSAATPGPACTELCGDGKRRLRLCSSSCAKRPKRTRS